jgi:hypothetical protein
MNPATSLRTVLPVYAVQAENPTDIPLDLPHLSTIALQLGTLSCPSPQSGQEGRSVMPQVNNRDNMEWTDTFPRARGVTLLPIVSAIVRDSFHYS